MTWHSLSKLHYFTFYYNKAEEVTWDYSEEIARDEIRCKKWWKGTKWGEIRWDGRRLRKMGGNQIESEEITLREKGKDDTTHDI